MNRSWIGLGMLVILLVLGLLVTGAMGRIHDPIAQDLEQAADYAMKEDWHNASRFLTMPGKTGKPGRIFAAALRTTPLWRRSMPGLPG